MDGVSGHHDPADSVRRATMEAVVAEHEAGLLRYATRILNNPFEAQDVVQNVFIRFFRNWDTAEPPDNLRAWLYRATHNEAVDHIRRESRRRELHEREGEERQREETPGGAATMTPEEKRERVLELLCRLDPREQQVILLRLDQGLSYEEISRVTGRSEGNVGNILHHAVKKLSRLLGAPPTP